MAHPAPTVPTSQQRYIAEFDSSFGYHIRLESTEPIRIKPCGTVEGSLAAWTAGVVDVYFNGGFKETVPKRSNVMFGTDLATDNSASEESVIAFGPGAFSARSTLAHQKVRELILKYFGIDPASSARFELHNSRHIVISGDGAASTMKVQTKACGQNGQAIGEASQYDIVTRGELDTIVVRGLPGAAVFIDGIEHPFEHVVLCGKL